MEHIDPRAVTHAETLPWRITKTCSDQRDMPIFTFLARDLVFGHVGRTLDFRDNIFEGLT